MKSRTKDPFWALYPTLPTSVQLQARQVFALFESNPDHPGLNFKKLKGPGSRWSVRFGNGYRAVGDRTGDTIAWFWIGTHQGYDKLF